MANRTQPSVSQLVESFKQLTPAERDEFTNIFNMCHRVIACSHCHEDIPLDTKGDHEKDCPKKPVSCSYCKQESLVQGELKTHLEKCNMKPRNCRLALLGCKFSGSKFQVCEHENKWESHMDLVLKHLMQNNNNIQQDKGKNRLADVVAIVKDLNNEHEVMKKRINELVEKVGSLLSGNKTLKDQLSKLESTHKADVASLKTLVEVLRKEIEDLRVNMAKQREEEDDDESEV